MYLSGGSLGFGQTEIKPYLWPVHAVCQSQHTWGSRQAQQEALGVGRGLQCQQLLAKKSVQRLQMKPGTVPRDPMRSIQTSVEDIPIKSELQTKGQKYISKRDIWGRGVSVRSAAEDCFLTVCFSRVSLFLLQVPPVVCPWALLFSSLSFPICAIRKMNDP